MLREAGADDLEGVERVAVIGRVDARIENRKTRVVKVAADAREQVNLVGRVDDHLQPLAGRGRAGAHDGQALADMARKLPRMPGDIGRVVAHEIAHIERVPQGLVRLKRLAVQRQQLQRVSLARFDLGICVRCTSAEHAQGVAVQIGK